MNDKVLLTHGGGGEEMSELIKDIFYKHFGNEILNKNEDAASLNVKENIAFTTDSFVVTPLFFNGGDIGKIAIAGTINDLVSMGAKPLYLSCGFIIEEGFSISELEKIVISMSKEMQKSGVKIVCGDTKVVPRGFVDKIFINTSGIGEIVCKDISSSNLGIDDTILITNKIGNHGACILSSRKELEIAKNIKSDCASLWHPINELFKNNIKPKALRDATRGGLSAVLNEWANASNVGILVNEDDVLVENEVKGVCEIFGFEPYEFANEGTIVICIKNEDAKKVVDILKNFEETKFVHVVGKVTNEYKKQVVLKSAWGTSRYLESPKGELLPRIC